MLNDDFKDMLQCLSGGKVEFLVIGGYALAAHGYPRATKDIDIWVAATIANAERLLRALAKFGAPMDQISRDDLAEIGNVFQIGVPPRRIDITTIADGVDFSECNKRCVTVEWDEIKVPVISKLDLIVNKRASARPHDLVDADVLEASDEE
ncbi:MAG: hypothetical protein ACI9HK_005911 [Pirellulaceae bacterium]|jgi:hypothetical protein